MDKPKQKEIELYQSKINSITEQANSLKIKTDKEMTLAVDYLKEIKQNSNKVREIKERYTKPANEILRMARHMFGPIEMKFKEAERIIKDKMIKFDELKQKKALEQSSKLAEQVKAGKLDIQTAGEKMEKIEPKNSYEGQEGAITYKMIKKIYITDQNKIPRKYLKVDEVLLKRDLLAGVKIPGAEIREDKIVASR